MKQHEVGIAVSLMGIFQLKRGGDILGTYPNVYEIEVG